MERPGVAFGAAAASSSGWRVSVVRGGAGGGWEWAKQIKEDRKHLVGAYQERNSKWLCAPLGCVFHQELSIK